MGTSLNGLTPAATYTGLLKFGDNSALTSTLKVVSDGAGNDTPLYLSSSAIAFGSSSNFYWDNTNSRLGIGTSSPTALLTLNGDIQFSGYNKTIASGTYQLDSISTDKIYRCRYIGDEGGQIGRAHV